MDLPLTVGHGECMVIADLEFTNPVRNLIVVIVLDIPPEARLRLDTWGRPRSWRRLFR